MHGHSIYPYTIVVTVCLHSYLFPKINRTHRLPQWHTWILRKVMARRVSGKWSGLLTPVYAHAFNVLIVMFILVLFV